MNSVLAKDQVFLIINHLWLCCHDLQKVVLSELKRGLPQLVSSLLYIPHLINLKYSIPKCSSFFSRDDLLTNWFFLSCILVKVSSLNLTFCRTSSLQSDEEEEPRKFHWITVKPAWFFAYFLFCLKNVINIHGGPSIDIRHVAKSKNLGVK